MSLQNKFLIIFLSSTLIPIGIVGLVGFNKAKQIIRDEVIAEHNILNKHKLENITNTINHAANLIISTSQYPPIEGIIRSRETGIDGDDQSTLQQWKKRLVNIFTILARTNKNIKEIWYLDENGQELVSIEVGQGGVSVSEKEKLTYRGDQDFFKETMLLDKGNVYISSLNLHEKSGKIEHPYRPFFRVSIPIFSHKEGSRKGVVSIDIIVSDTLEHLAEASIGHVILTDQDGNFFLNPDKKKEFSLQRGKAFNYFKEQPELIKNIRGETFKVHHDKKEKEMRIWRKFFYDGNNKENYWIIFSVIPEKKLFASIQNLKQLSMTIFGMTMLIVAGIILLFSKIFIRSILELTKSAENISKGKLEIEISPVLINTQDEIGRLAEAFEFMRSKLKESYEKMQEKVDEKTVYLTSSLKNLEMQNGLLQDMKRASQEEKVKLKESEIKIRTIVATAVDGIIVIDSKGIVDAFNVASERMFGYKAKEIIGKNVKILMPDPYHSEHDQYLKKYKDTGERKIIGIGREVIGRRKDGTHFPIDLAVSEMKFTEKRMFTGIIRDISARKKAEEDLKIKTEELFRSNQELEQFAYVASHDLQEPLRMVASYTQLLARRYKDKLDDSALEFINYAVDGATRMQKLIDALLMYSRIETKGGDFEKIDCNTIYKKSSLNLKVAIEESKAEIQCADLPVVIGDEIQLIQLFQNLMANAIKFCKEKTPCICVSAVKEESNWIFSVKDNGIGIEEQYVKKIFVIFQRLHTKKEYPGTGIGLSVCKKIVERHGGKIWVESKPKEGTTFYFTIPIKGEA